MAYRRGQPPIVAVTESLPPACLELFEKNNRAPSDLLDRHVRGDWGIVGGTGKVIGIDVTPEMVEKARSNIALMGLTHAKVELGDFLKLPLDENSVNVVISNGAINLSPKQACVFQEIFRVLKPNGRLYLADMIRLDTSCQSDNSADSWANCVAGTLSKACLEKLISDTGFQGVTFIRTTGYHTSPETEGAIFRATKPVS